MAIPPSPKAYACSPEWAALRWGGRNITTSQQLKPRREREASGGVFAATAPFSILCCLLVPAARVGDIVSVIHV